MSVTMQQVLAQLQRDEPNYMEAAQLGVDALPHLAQIVQYEDALLASKAAYLASLIQSDQSFAVLEQAVGSPHPEVRVAAASGIRNLSQLPPQPMLERLLRDQDIGVRKEVLRSIEYQQPVGFKAQVEEIAKNDPNIDIQRLANKVANSLR
jgi:HEAT repeat protein